MRPLEPLAPDQRAVVALVLQQGRTYEEIAALLGIPPGSVRDRAHAGLAALSPANGLPAEVTAPLADYLLGQQPPADAEATRGLLAESAPAREWASGVAARLADAAPGPLPGIPEPPAATPTAAAAAEKPPASRIGGALLIAGVLLALGVVLFLVLRGGEGPAPESAATPAATATATATPAAGGLRVADTIELQAAPGSDATGTMTIYLQGEDQLVFELVAENMPPNADGAAYAVWLTGPGTRARRLGFAAAVGEDGRLGIQGPSERDVARFPRLYATFENVVVSEESRESATRPSRAVLTGALPNGR